MWRDCVEGRVVDDDCQNAVDAVTQRLSAAVGQVRRSLAVETVIHHRHEFALYSLRNIEPMKVDMHTCISWDNPRSNFFVPLRRRAAAFKGRCSLSVVAFGAPANNTLQ